MDESACQSYMYQQAERVSWAQSGAAWYDIEGSSQTAGDR